MDKVESLAEQVCREQGCYLYDVEFSGLGKGRTLRIFVDKEGGVGIEDCSNVSKGMNVLLDEQDVIPGGEYNLEVSTPGVDRILRKPWHFEKVVGKKISVRSREAMESFGVTNAKWAKTKNVEETLAAADQDGLLFEPKEGPMRIPYSAVEKAKVVFVFNGPAKQPGKKK